MMIGVAGGRLLSNASGNGWKRVLVLQRNIIHVLTAKKRGLTIENG
jgi:hypothetical protein